MSIPLYRPDSRTLDPGVRLTTRPGDGMPKPTGYYPNLVGERSRDRVSDHDVLPYAGEHDARQEILSRYERVDQHAWAQVDATLWPAVHTGRRDGRHDPLTDGPTGPVARMLGLFYQRAQGTDQTRFLDVPGRAFPANGSQDGVTWTYFQNARIAMAPMPTDGSQAPDSLQALPPSPTRGWTVRPVENAKQETIKKTRSLRQQQNPHQDRLASATAAGQTYSQRTAHVGAGRQQTAPIRTWRSRG